MNSNSGNVINLKFTTYSALESVNGNKAVTKMTIIIIMLNAITKYLNFNENAPIINILERSYYVNAVGLYFRWGWG